LAFVREYEYGFRKFRLDNQFQVPDSLAGCGKTLSESFDQAQDERRAFDITEDFPFMLRLSKHSEPFFSKPLVRSLKPET
jgi:hypothetical protein